MKRKKGRNGQERNLCGCLHSRRSRLWVEAFERGQMVRGGGMPRRSRRDASADYFRVARYTTGIDSVVQLISRKKTSRESGCQPPRFGRFTSKWRCQCGCRMLADLSLVISHMPAWGP